jgi:hypothetical protein
MPLHGIPNAETLMTYEHKKPEPERREEPRTRSCLVCKTPFHSPWRGERICRRCKTTEAWRTGTAVDRAVR